MVCVATCSPFFHDQSFFHERTTNKETMVVQTLVFGRQFFENKPREPVTPRETTNICCQSNMLQQIGRRSIFEKPAVIH